MKNLILILSFILLVSCENKPFTGYVVGKEYIEGHMCHDEGYNHVVQAAVIVPPHVHTHHHRWEDSQFILHVANYQELRHIKVDSSTYVNSKMLELKTFK